MRRLLAFSGLLFLLVTAGATTASAHVIASTGYSTVHQDGDRVTYRLSLEYDVLARAVDLGAPATDDGQRAQALDAAKPALAEYLHDRVVVSLDGAACEPALETTSVGPRAQKQYAELGLVFSCAGERGSFHLQYSVFGEAEAVADDHTTLVESHHRQPGTGDFGAAGRLPRDSGERVRHHRRSGEGPLPARRRGLASAAVHR